MILCDLPYGKTARNKWDKIIDLDSLWEEYKRIIKINGVIIFTADQPFSSVLVMSNPKWFRYSLVWHKTSPTGFLNAHKMPLRSHEDILIFYRKLPTYNPQKTDGHTRKISTAQHKRNSVRTSDYGEHGLTTYNSTERFPISVLTFKTDKQISSLHPTQKPVALFEYLIRTYTNENDLVLDPVIGSGTTAVACIKAKRRFIGIEKEEQYYKLATQRINEV